MALSPQTAPYENNAQKLLRTTPHQRSQMKTFNKSRVTSHIAWYKMAHFAKKYTFEGFTAEDVYTNKCGRRTR